MGPSGEIPRRQKSVPSRGTQKLAWLLYHGLFCLGLYLFFTGFFPSKLALSGYSPRSNETLLESKPRFERLVIMLVDAMRADFAFGDRSLEGSTHNMPFLRELVERGNAMALSTFAHAPTVTLPRVKALVTGGIPSFIDYVTNLNSPELLEDNLIYQLSHAGKKLVFYGDDTWLKLFPRIFSRAEGTTSFFVADTVEVDNNVTRNLDREIHGDWDVLILHYLGLDHIGHSAGPESPLLPPKLLEMDLILRRLYESLAANDPKTLIVLCGDHGMSEVGSHGGSSASETNPALLLASSSFSTKATRWPPVISEQINLVPTLAILFGLPIPKNSLGVLLPEVLTASNLTLTEQLDALALNSAQMRGILKLAPALWIDSETPIEPVQESLTILEKAKELHATFSRSQDANVGSEARERYFQFLRRSARDLALKLTDYDLATLLVGFLLICIAALGTLVELIRAASATQSSAGLGWRFKGLSFLLFGTTLFSYIIIWAAESIFMRHIGSNYWAALLCICAGIGASTLIIRSSALMVAIRKLWCAAMHGASVPARTWLLAFPALLFSIVHIVSVGSSSFIEEEHQIAYFFYVTLLILLYIYITKNQHEEHSESATGVAAGFPAQTIMVTFRFAVLLVAFAVTRKWNQTGNKWAGFPDLSQLVTSCPPVLMQSLIAISLGALAILNHIWVSQSRNIYKFIVDVVLLCILEFKLDLYLGLGPVWAARAIFISLASLAIIISSNRSRIVIILLGALQILLAKPANAPVVALIVIQAAMLVDILKEPEISPSIIATLFHFATRAAWFALGNSNSLSSIDLAGAYIGLDSYDPIKVGILLIISTYAGPFIMFAAQLAVFAETGKLQKQSPWSESLLCFGALRTWAVVVFCVVITVVRYHLFIWSVFSPKFFYECFHTLFATIMYIITFIVASFSSL